jgi:preprotein translocase subunit SecB
MKAGHCRSSVTVLPRLQIKGSKEGDAMAESNRNEETQPGNGRTGGPSVQVLGQYIKDLSCENPNAPASFQPQKAQPKLAVELKVEVRPLAESMHEVTLHGDIKLANETSSLFQMEIAYAGAYRIENLSSDVTHQVLRVQCPTLLFPFLRRIVADTTRDGGFPPLLLDPVDFATLYQQEAARRVSESGQAVA